MILEPVSSPQSPHRLTKACSAAIFAQLEAIRYRRTTGGYGALSASSLLQRETLLVEAQAAVAELHNASGVTEFVPYQIEDYFGREDEGLLRRDIRPIGSNQIPPHYRRVVLDFSDALPAVQTVHEEFSRYQGEEPVF